MIDINSRMVIRLNRGTPPRTAGWKQPRGLQWSSRWRFIIAIQNQGGIWLRRPWVLHRWSRRFSMVTRFVPRDRLKTDRILPAATAHPAVVQRREMANRGPGVHLQPYKLNDIARNPVSDRVARCNPDLTPTQSPAAFPSACQLARPFQDRLDVGHGMRRSEWFVVTNAPQTGRENKRGVMENLI